MYYNYLLRIARFRKEKSIRMQEIEAKIEKYVKVLRENDIRMTSQRYAILKYLAEDEKHPTANEIYEDLKDDFPNMSVATIYNNLNFFMQAGIVNELPFGDGSSRFDLTDTQHYHVICNNCGKVEDFNYPGLAEVEKVVESMTNFKVDGHRFKVTGLCKDCQKLKS